MWSHLWGRGGGPILKTSIGPPRVSPLETSIENFTRPEFEAFAQRLWDQVGLGPHAVASRGKADRIRKLLKQILAAQQQPAIIGTVTGVTRRCIYPLGRTND